MIRQGHGNFLICKGRFTHSMPFPCRPHAVPLPCRAAKGLECVFPIWFTQCGRVWFTLAMPRPCHPRPCRSSQGHRTRRCCTVLCCCPEKNGIVGAWHGRGMASVNQTRPHYVNQMGKTHSKPLAALHGRGTAWKRHAMCESALKRLYRLSGPTYSPISGYRRCLPKCKVAAPSGWPLISFYCQG